MRTNIVIDDELMEQAMRVSGAATKREAVESALRLLVRLKQQERIRGSPRQAQMGRRSEGDAA